MKRPNRLKAINRLDQRAIAAVGLVAVVGAVVWLTTRAAEFPGSLEPEQGNLSEACISPDPAASGGGAVKFGGGCLLDALFNGEAQLVEDSRFSVDRPDLFRDGNGTGFHAETATVHYKGRHLMFYRTLIRPDGGRQTNGVPAGIALATSQDGHSWQVQNEGRPVIASRLSRLQAGTSCNPSPCELAIYAPSVIVDGDGLLKIVYETMDTGVNQPASIPRHWIEAASSGDGLTWQTINDGGGAPAKILVAAAAWEGYDAAARVFRANVGTPSLTKEGGTYHLYYHGHHCCAGQSNRGLASGNSLTSLARSTANPSLKPGSGWQAFGPGKGDIVKEGNYYYYIFEGWKGSDTCGRNDTIVSWGLARSTDRINWTYAAANPIRTDRIKASCGEDMPSWQVISGETPMVITTNVDYPTATQASVRRYRLASTKSALSNHELVGIGLADSDDGYWQVARDGGVFAYGNAAFHGSAAPAGRTDIIGMAARPQGDGYWVAAANGAVYGFGAAAHRGDMAGQALNRPIVGIERDPDGDGYWLVAADGGIFAFNAPYHGSAGNIALNQPIVAMASTADGGGYWLVARDGGVFAYGNAQNHGSLPGIGVARSDIIGLTVRRDGQGYWLVSADGAVYSFNAQFYGGTDGFAPFTNMRIAAVGRHAVGAGAGSGYYLMARDGGVIDFGSAVYHGHARGPGWNN